MMLRAAPQTRWSASLESWKFRAMETGGEVEMWILIVSGLLVICLAFPVPSSQADLHDHAFGKEGWYPLLLSALGKLSVFGTSHVLTQEDCPAALWNFELSPDGLVKVLTRKRRSSCSSRHANKSGQHLNFWAGWDSWQLFEETGGMCFLLWEFFCHPRFFYEAFYKPLPEIVTPPR